jgi:prophage endopeptidase
MISQSLKDGIKDAGLILSAALFFIAGWTVENWRAESQINTLKSTYANSQRVALEQVVKRLDEANRRADIALATLQQREQVFQQLTQEKDREIRRLTTGSRCLGSAAVRVLNSASTNQPAALSETTSQPVSTDTAFATDTDVGIWINNAQQAYESCRGRIKAIADYFAGESKQ